mmetsp:Transcript_22731/g.34445  ORF Transcript_22731/g.34445 Transcript_22731/m.34445 type:complete len:84 (-) Transcript_22731:141-392(-)
MPPSEGGNGIANRMLKTELVLRLSVDISIDAECIQWKKGIALFRPFDPFIANNVLWYDTQCDEELNSARLQIIASNNQMSDRR